MKIEIKEHEWLSLNGLKSSLFELKYIEGRLVIISLINKKIMAVVEDDLTVLQPFGFDVKILLKANMGDIECICQERQLNYTYCYKRSVRIFRDDVGNLVDFNRILREEGYYV
jgi:hypothetical protein